MILCINPNDTRSNHMCDEPFIVTDAESAIETVKLMEYLQRFRPEKKVIQLIELDASETSLSFLAMMEARHWNYPLKFREKPTHAIQLILNRNRWNYTVKE